MPSRKKAKGQARKAAKVKKEEAAIAEKARQEEEQYRELEQSQIQRLRVNNQSSVPTICMHGFVPFLNDDICSKFIREFVREFYTCLRKMFEAGKKADRVIIECLLKAREVTKEVYSEVWNSSDKMKQVIKYFLHNGTMLVLDEIGGNARNSALFARFFEQWLKVEVHKQACIDWLKVIETTVCDDRTLVKYFWRRIRCSCLDNAYEEAQSIPKTSICFNPQCSHLKSTVERSKLRCCSRCRSIAYCSRECQVADWASHASFCDIVATAKAEFDASQQQQS